MANPAPAYGLAVSIDEPPPAAPALTLVGASRVINPTDDKWIGGVAARSYGNDLPDTYDACQSPSSAGHAKAAGTPTEGYDTFGSFAVVLGVTCTTRGMARDFEDWKSRAGLLLEAREHWAIEREFWTGALKPDNPHLAQPSATMVQVATMGARHGVAALEQAIADAGGDGMIHLRPGVFSLLDHTDLSVAGGVAKTQLGTPVVPGVGYAGTSPAQAALATTVEWAYATGRVQVRRSEVFINPATMAEATDRGVNTTTFRAERYVLISWDRRIHAAAKIDRAFTGFAS